MRLVAFFILFLNLVTQLVLKITIMGFPTKVQLIKRAKSEQWYINFPSAIAQAMEFQRGEVVEWLIEDKKKLILQRKDSNVNIDKKKPQEDL